MRHRLLADETILLSCLQRLGLQDTIWPSWLFDQHGRAPKDAVQILRVVRMWDRRKIRPWRNKVQRCWNWRQVPFFVSYAVVSDRFLAFLNTEKRNIEKSRTRTVFQSHGWGKSFERLRGFLLHLNAAPFIPQCQQQKNTLTRNSILSRTIGSRTFQDSSTYLRC